MGMLADYLSTLTPEEAATIDGGTPLDINGVTYSWSGATPSGQDAGNPVDLNNGAIMGWADGSPTGQAGVPFALYDPHGGGGPRMGATTDAGGNGLSELALVAGVMAGGVGALGGFGAAGADASLAVQGDSINAFEGSLGGLDGGAGLGDLAVQGDSINALEGNLAAGVDGGAGASESEIAALMQDPATAGGLGGAGAAGAGAAGLGGLGSAAGLGGLLGPLTSILGGGLGLASGQKGQDLINSLLGKMDPFAPYRQGYANQLQNLMNDPKGSVASLPGYQAGLDAVQRSGAAQGYTGSGNMETNLLQYGGSMWQQQEQNLAQLAGANFAPGNTAPLAGLAGQAQATTNNSIMNLVKGLGGLGQQLPSIGSGGGFSGGGGDMGADYAAQFAY